MYVLRLGSSSSSHVQQQQQHNAASQSSNTNAVQQPLQQAFPPSSVAAQHQQIMYQGSSPVNGPRQPNVVGASPQSTMIRHAAFINAGSGPPPPQHMMAMGHGPSAPQQGGPLQSATPDSMRPQYFGHDPNVTSKFSALVSFVVSSVISSFMLFLQFLPICACWGAFF